MKFGTILYRKGVDILISLSWALSGIPSVEDNDDDNSFSVSVPNNKVVLYEAGYVVNELIHKVVEKQSLTRQSSQTGDYDLYQ